MYFAVIREGLVTLYIAQRELLTENLQKTSNFNAFYLITREPSSALYWGNTYAATYRHTRDELRAIHIVNVGITLRGTETSHPLNSVEQFNQ